ncbi:lipocalin-like domain-containing protein [Flavobacterium nitrogenifigens]|uniref:Lipocalin-like domain-containing protein n=1 Tax=Flavobacterium nitrogenifigens TaxID=1617283 RepID=A0A521D1V7_9FLAO|nr:lipocalin-like domain-containing protein [Flavobacterium nitrogenifigens]KAF2332752.1 lipocalin-like domain-containing protein [Flavobacterium nitrogenifigens]SMO65679.1 Lipocalin-like domain-containing protein [Flavobacterium nitrogenifigens]
MKNVILILLLLILNSIHAQKKSEFSGSWTLVSVENTNSDGTKSLPYDTNPKGFLFFDEKGNYAIQIYKDKRAKIASGDKNKCTPEENAAIVQGSNSHFGKYQIDETNKTITFKIKTASFPNWEGTIQMRSYTFANNELKYAVTNTTQGGKSVTAEVVWKKL